MTGTRQDVSVTSEPEKASVAIKSTSGIQVFSGATPATAKLDRSKEYTVKISLDGFEAQEVFIGHTFNGWAIGNLICGGVIGIVLDFVDGAIWNLDPDMIHVELVKVLSYGGESVYAVVGAIDDNGQLRTTAVPLIPTAAR